jgi:hypothetical protein
MAYGACSARQSSFFAVIKCSMSCTHNLRPPSVRKCPKIFTSPRRGERQVSPAAREPKDPKQFANMDEARSYLMGQQSGLTMQTLLNWMSESAISASSKWTWSFATMHLLPVNIRSGDHKPSQTHLPCRSIRFRACRGRWLGRALQERP